MKYLSALKDITLTIAFISVFFLILSLLAESKISVSKQENEVITLMPEEAYLRGFIRINDDKSISNWRNNKNIVHWKFDCTQEGRYKAVLIHSRASKDHTVILRSKSDQFMKELSKSEKETELGIFDLKQGIQSVAFYAPEVPKKTKLPAIYSIILTKIK